MTVPIVIRAIRADDLENYKTVRLRALQESPTAFASTYAEASQFSDEEWSNRVDECMRVGSTAFLAFDERDACGIIRGSPDDSDPRIGWLESMWITPWHRRQGVGSKLVRHVIDWAKELGLRELKLEVTDTNEPAIQLYKRCGFQPTGHKSPYQNNANLTELEMLIRLDLPRDLPRC